MKRSILVLAAIISISACQTKNPDDQFNNQDKGKIVVEI